MARPGTLVKGVQAGHPLPFARERWITVVSHSWPHPHFHHARLLLPHFTSAGSCPARSAVTQSDRWLRRRDSGGFTTRRRVEDLQKVFELEEQVKFLP